VVISQCTAVTVLERNYRTRKEIFHEIVKMVTQKHREVNDHHVTSHDRRNKIDRITKMREIKQQLATIESRLNRILDVLNPPTPSSKVPNVAPVAKKTKKGTIEPVVVKKVVTPAKAVVVKRLLLKK